MNFLNIHAGRKKIHRLELNNKSKPKAYASVFRHFDDLLSALDRYNDLDDNKKELYKSNYEKLLKRIRITSKIMENIDEILAD